MCCLKSCGFLIVPGRPARYRVNMSHVGQAGTRGSAGPDTLLAILVVIGILLIAFLFIQTGGFSFFHLLWVVPIGVFLGLLSTGVPLSSFLPGRPEPDVASFALNPVETPLPASKKAADLIEFKLALSIDSFVRAYDPERFFSEDTCFVIINPDALSNEFYATVKLCELPAYAETREYYRIELAKHVIPASGIRHYLVRKLGRNLFKALEEQGRDFYLVPPGRRDGPYSFTQLFCRVLDGKIDPSTPVLKSGDPHVMPVSDLLKIKEDRGLPVCVWLKTNEQSRKLHALG
jgi:hypothetical protein